MRTVFALIALAVALSGCVSNQPRVVSLSTPFDVSRAQQLMAKGANTIKGSALMRQAGGGVVTCAGREVILVPDTPYSAQRQAAIYGSATKGFASAAATRIVFSPDDPDYRRLRHSTICDAQGYFKFSDVADGSFFVIATIAWMAGQYSQQGGGLLLGVTVKGGETKDVVLAP